MANNVKHIKSQPDLNPEILKMISGTSIAWNKTSEEIWPELWEKIENKKPVSKNSKTIYLMVARYAAAAVLALLIGLSSTMYFYTKTIKTPVKQQTEVLLPDNSKVTLFEQSSLSYKPLLWKFLRSVKFEGEGLFEVQKGKNFEVVSQMGKTIVLGTQFNVYSRNNNYNVTCLSGKVKVAENSQNNEVIITGGQKAVLKTDGHFEIINNSNLLPHEKVESQNKSKEIEEELNTVLKIEAETEHVDKTEEKTKSIEVQTTTPQNATEGKLNLPEKPNVITEQNKVKKETEIIQNKEQSETKAEGDEVQNQAKTQSKEIPIKDKFRASLTPQQISILENQQMSKEEKRKAFMQSLSNEQKQLLKEQNEDRAKAEANKNGNNENEKVKDQQKSQIREQIRESSGKENKEQQRQQNRENKENRQPGEKNTPAGGDKSQNQTGKGN